MFDYSGTLSTLQDHKKNSPTGYYINSCKKEEKRWHKWLLPINFNGKLSSLQGVRATRSLVLCVMFCKSLFLLLSFFFIVVALCPFSIYGFWLPLGIFKLFFIILDKLIFNIYKISIISIALKDVFLERYVLFYLVFFLFVYFCRCHVIFV